MLRSTIDLIVAVIAGVIIVVIKDVIRKNVAPCTAREDERSDSPSGMARRDDGSST